MIITCNDDYIKSIYEIYKEQELELEKEKENVKIYKD